MTPFTRLTGIAAPLVEENVDTDIIYPARFLLVIARDGLGDFAFHDRRASDPDFVLSRKPFSEAQVLIAGANFGCGSSREQAVWALLGFGISCIIAPSFGEIFHANCIRNGLLPVTLPDEVVAELAACAECGEAMTVDLEAQTVVIGTGHVATFDIAPAQKRALFNGWDETATILNTHANDIATFEARQRGVQPWLWDVVSLKA